MDQETKDALAKFHALKPRQRRALVEKLTSLAEWNPAAKHLYEAAAALCSVGHKIKADG